MTVSVIIPTYNHASLLSRAVASIPRAASGQIIIVDDGSTDDTAAVIARLAAADARIVPVLLPKNGGVNAARNAGIAKATGEWISLLDSDDEYVENGFDSLCRELVRTPADIDVVGCMTLREVGGRMEPRGYLPGKVWDLHQPSYQDVLLKEGIRGDIHYCVRRSVFAQGYKFDDHINGFESAFFAKLAKDGKKFLYFNVVVDRRYNAPGHHLSDEPYKRWPRQFARAYRAFVREHYEALRARPGALRSYYRRIGSSMLRAGDPMGLGWILKAALSGVS